jgi:hypothetical protein
MTAATRFAGQPTRPPLAQARDRDQADRRPYGPTRPALPSFARSAYRRPVIADERARAESVACIGYVDRGHHAEWRWMPRENARSAADMHAESGDRSAGSDGA